MKNRQGTSPENKWMWLFTLLPVKNTFTMSNIWIVRKAIMDLILGNKERNVGEAYKRLHKTVWKLIKEDHMSVFKQFFDIKWLETRTKKYVHFLIDGVSVSVVLGEECKPKPRAHKGKRKEEEEDDEPTVLSASYEVRVGLDLGLHYFFVAMNNMNAEDKMPLAKMSFKEYYHESKCNRNISKGKK